MPPLVAAAAVTAGGMIAGGAIQSRAAGKAGKLQTDAATRAGDIEAKAQAEALRYTQQKDAQDRADSNAAQLANYGQYADRERRIGTLGEMLGLGGRTPAPPPSFLTGGAGQPAGASGATSGPNPGVSADKGDIASQVAAYYQARGVAPNPSSVQYWAQKWGEFGAKDPAYFNMRLAQADEFGGGAPAPAAAPRMAPPPVTLGSMARRPRTLTPALSDYAPGTIGSYLGR